MRLSSLKLGISFVCVLLLLGAQCEEQIAQKPLEYSLSVSFDEGGESEIPSNGLSYTSVVIEGEVRDPNSNTTSSDNSAITVRVNEGKLTGDENTQPSETFTTIVGVPQQGSITINFQCKMGFEGEVMLQIDNKNDAKTVFPVTCVQPVGETKIVIDKSSCENILLADGISSCLVQVDAFYDFDETVINELGFESGENADYTAEDLRIPQTDIVLEVESTLREVALGSIITEGNEDVLALTDDGSELSNLISLAKTDTTGRSQFFVFSPLMGLEETLTIKVTGNDIYGASIKNEQDIVIKPFIPQTNLLMETSRTHIIGDGESNAAIILSVKNLYGQAAELDTVNLTISGLGEASLVVREDSDAVLTGETDTKRLILDSNGEAALELTGPLLDIAEVESMEVGLAALYDPGQGFEILQQAVTITISPPGSLIMNVDIEPTVINADENTYVTLTSEISIGSNPQVQHPVSFVIPISDQSKIHFGLPGNPDAEPGEVTKNTNENGKASVTIAASSTEIRALTTVYVSTNLDGQELSETVRIDVQRAPFLQSIVFQSASPNILGIRGSSQATSSVVSFQILDDLSSSMADVPVDFRVNDTAGSGVSVTSRSLSDSGGNVSAVFSAGTQAGPVTVVATADPDGLFGGPVTVESAPIAIIGGIPNFAHSSFLCPPSDSIFIAPSTVTCEVTLVDRFTDVSTGANLVQFRTEGGNINPMATGSSSVSGTFTTGEPGKSVASIFSHDGDSWSYGVLIPTKEVVVDANPRLYDNGTLTGGEDGTALNFFDYCFDGSSYTPCDLVSLCITDQNQFYCPLAPDVVDPSQGCWVHLLKPWDHIPGGDTLFPNGALSALILGSDDPTINALAPLQDPYCPGKYISGEAYYNPLCGRHTIVKEAVDTYVEIHRSCGAPISCLTGLQDLDFVDGDECDLAFGCFDFTSETACPQDGLITIMASFRGEEAFVDLNGNGLFDYNDENDNGKHDKYEFDHEPFIDMPEPFLDKNNNCGYDVFSTEADGFQTGERMALYDALRHSDLFLDEDGSEDYGYQMQPEEDQRAQGNGQYDRDKDIFFQTYILSLTEEFRMIIGEPCSGDDVGKLVNCSLGTENQSVCRETKPLYNRQDIFYEGIAEDCSIPESAGGFEDGTAFELAFNVQDLNGNCHSPGFSSSLTVSVEGAIRMNGEFANSESLDFEEQYCGFYGSIGNSRNRTRPWCETASELGPQNISHNFVLACPEAAAGLTPFSISASVSSGGSTITVKKYGDVYCPFCGDGQKSGSEMCDDGNENSGDGCNSVCIVECGWQCENDTSSPDAPQNCAVRSGTDYITAGYEVCDDGNFFENDGCDENQQQEAGYDCTYVDFVGDGCHPDYPGKKSTCTLIETTEEE